MVQTLTAYRQYAYTFGFLLAVLFVGGCSALPGYGDTKIDTARKAVVQASAEVRAGYLLLDNLIDNRTIDAATARSAKDRLDQANAGVNTVFMQIQRNGDPSQIGDSLEATLVAIDVAMGLLGQYTSPGG